MLRCVAECCSVLQCVAVCCNVLQCDAECQGHGRSLALCALTVVLQSAAVCCSVLQCVAVYCRALQCVAVCCSVLQTSPPSGESYYANTCHTSDLVLQCVLQCVAVCCSVSCSAPRIISHTSSSRKICSADTRHTSKLKLQHTATHCSAACCSTLQHTAAHRKTLQHTATHCNTPRIISLKSPSGKICSADTCHTSKLKLQHTKTHCSTLQHTAIHCNTLQHTATHRALSRSCRHRGRFALRARATHRN